MDQQQKAIFFPKYQIKWTLDLYLCACKSKSTSEDKNDIKKSLRERENELKQRLYQDNNPTLEVLLPVHSPKGKDNLMESKVRMRGAPMPVESIQFQGTFCLSPIASHHSHSKWYLQKRNYIPNELSQKNMWKPNEFSQEKTIYTKWIFTRKNLVYPIGFLQKIPMYT